MRDWITSKRCVSRKRGDNVQRLLKITYLFGIKIDVAVLDEEIIPHDVMIRLGCFGDVGDWKSKFYGLKDAWPEAA